jgi:hypothetical protein
MRQGKRQISRYSKNNFISKALKLSILKKELAQKNGTRVLIDILLFHNSIHRDSTKEGRGFTMRESGWNSGGGS